MLSTVSNPVRTKSVFDDTSFEAYLKPRSRTRPEAEGIARQGRGTLCLALEVEGREVMPAHRRQTEPKNHMKENVRRIREMQKSARQRTETEASQPVKALWKLAQFDSVESKVKEDLQKSTLAPRPQSASYLRAHSRTGYIPQSARPASAEPPLEKLTVPKAATARDVHLVHKDIDFIRVNSMAVKKLRTTQRSASMLTLDEMKKKVEEDDKNYKRGEMPKYLIDRKKQWEKEEKERLANTPDPDLPAGHRLMADDERRETLARIKQKQSELMAELASIPICNDSLRVRKRREELEQKLAKIEEAVNIFSRQKVFVKLE